MEEIVKYNKQLEKDFRRLKLSKEARRVMRLVVKVYYTTGVEHGQKEYLDVYNTMLKEPNKTL